MNGWIMLNGMPYVLLLVMRDIVKLRKKTGFSVNACLSTPGLGWKNFNSLRTEDDEPLYKYNDKYMRHSVRQSIKGGRVCALNQ